MDKQDIAQTYARRAALNDSPLVQRAVQRLHDKIGQREDIGALQIVLARLEFLERVYPRLMDKLQHVSDILGARTPLPGESENQERAVYGPIDALLREVLDDSRNTVAIIEPASIVKARDLIEDRLGAFRKGHANDSTAWEHYNTGFAEGMMEALNIVKAVMGDCGCADTYPQLVPGKVSHGPGCPNRE